jgi:hypothetical protein
MVNWRIATGPQLLDLRTVSEELLGERNGLPWIIVEGRHPGFPRYPAFQVAIGFLGKAIALLDSSFCHADEFRHVASGKVFR